MPKIPEPIQPKRVLTGSDLDIFDRLLDSFIVERYSEKFQVTLRYHDIPSAMQAYGATGDTGGVVAVKYRDFMELFDASSVRREKRAYAKFKRDRELQGVAKGISQDERV